MTEYKSIKEDVLRKLEENVPLIQNRFGLGERSSASISRLIKEACDVIL